MHVVELEALHLRPVDQRRVRRGEPQAGAPHRRGAGCVELAERPLQDRAPGLAGAVDAAADRIEDQQLDALAHLLRDGVVGQAGDEFGDRAGVWIADGVGFVHWE